MPEIAGFSWTEASRPTGSGVTLEVGEGKEFATVQEAYAASSDGDTILVHEGTYTFVGNEYYPSANNDHPILIQHSVQIIGVGDVTFDGSGWVVKGMLVTSGAPDMHLYIENINFINAANDDNNGAGVRHQSGDLTIVDSTFLNNESGVLAAGDSGVTHVVNSSFDITGSDGYSHPLYLQGERAIVEDSHFEGSISGHHVKSIAGETIIVNNYLDDGTGTASYLIDVTAGGDTLIHGNTIIKGALAENGSLIYYDMNRHGGEPGEVIIQNNVIDGSNYPNPDSMELIWNRTDSPIQLLNNTITGVLEDRLIIGLGHSEGNTLDGAPLATQPYNDGAISLTAGDDILVQEEVGTTTPIEGGAGNDFMVGYVGNDTFFGDAGADLLIGDKGGDLLIGGANDDSMFGGNDADTLGGGSGNDLIDGGAGNDRVYAGAGDDTLVGGGGRDTLSGGDGNDLVIGNDSNAVMTGGENVVGNAGDDTLFGAGGRDAQYGGEGTDLTIIRGTYDPDDAASSDYEVYEQWGHWRVKGITEAGMIEAGDGINYWEGQIFYDDIETVYDIELIQFDNGVFDTRTGTFTEGQQLVDLEQILAGLPSSPVSSEPVEGTSGDDTFVLEPFNSFTTYIGGDGYDIAVASAADMAIRLDSLATGDLEEISADGNNGVFILGSSGDNHLDLSATILTGIGSVDAGFGDDFVSTGSGNETIVGGYGDDTLLGGDGDDRFEIGLGHGHDSIDGGAGNDVIAVVADDAIVGLTNTAIGTAGIETISAAGQTAAILSAGDTDDTWDLSGITLTNIASINLNGGDDTVTGSAAAEALKLGDGDDIVDGGAGNDTILGGAGLDLMSGGEGDDVFEVGVGHGYDRFDGGDGNDTIRVIEDGTVIGLASSDTAYGMVSPVLNVETIDGAGHADVVIAGSTNASNNYRDIIDLSDVMLIDIAKIDLGAGNDTLYAGAADDVIVGGDGGDSLSGGAGNDVFLVGADDNWNDRFDGGDGTDIIRATGDGTIIGLASDHSYFGLVTPTLNIEQIDGAGFANVIIQGVDYNSHNQFDYIDLTGVTLTGIERIELGAGDDTIVGSSGDDVIVGGEGGDSMAGGAGNDIFLVGPSDTWNDRFDGGDGTDVIRGTGDNTVIGLASDHSHFGLVTPTLNIEQIDGAGFDNVVIQGVDYHSHNLFDYIDLTGANLTDIARIELGQGDDTLIASAGDDVILGEEGNDNLTGGGGSDTFVFGAGWGVDTVQDMGADDVLDFSSAGVDLADVTFIRSGNSLIVDAGDGNKVTLVDASGVSLTGANFIFADGVPATLPPISIIGTWQADNLVGTGLADVIDGAGWKDTISGGGGDDTIIGGDHSDTLYGGDGDDVFLIDTNDGDDIFDGGAGFDIVLALADGISIGMQNIFGPDNALEEISAHGHTGVSIQGGWQSGNWDFSQTTLTGITEIRGGDGHDTIIGSSGDDTFLGGRHNDVLSGGAGNDTFLVDTDDGYDVLDGGAGYDAVVATVDGATLGLETVFDASNNIEEFSANGHSNVEIVGTYYNNAWDFSTVTLSGGIIINPGDGHDTVIGSAGDDRFIGGNKNDVLTGGAGSDIFVFSAGDDSDTITDFEDGVDLIDLSATGLQFADLAINASGADTVIIYGADQILLTGIDPAAITADDFLL